MYLKGKFVKYLILLSTWEWANMLVLCKYMYIFIIGNQLTTQNNDKYYPEILTGTAFSIKKYAQIITWQTLQPQGRNRMRWSRQRAELLPSHRTDGSGYYRFDNVAEGDWRVEAKAAHHQKGTSQTHSAAPELQIEVADIRLGPGYQLAGLVTDARELPVADADVIARERASDGRSRRGRPRDYRGKTDERGHFLLEHLPGSSLDVTVEKASYLPSYFEEIDAKLNQRMFVKLLDGLHIAGVVVDGTTGAPVTRYAVLAQRLRSFPRPGEDDLRNRLRTPGLGESERRAVERELRSLAAPPRARGWGGWANSRDKKHSDHPDGRFRETGLEDGVYVVTITASTHADYRSDEIELRVGQATTEVRISLDAGLTITGVVRDEAEQPIVGAQVELRRAGERDNRRGGMSAMRGMRINSSRTRAIAQSTTDREGRYAIEHVPAGRYLVKATAPSRDDTATDPFELSRDMDVDLVLGALGKLEGRVLGATAEQIREIRVIAIEAAADLGSMFRGGRRSTVDAKPNGTYVFEGLSPGNYVVRAILGGSMADLVGEFLGTPPPPDVQVRANESSTFDPRLRVPLVGSVQGSVMHNGQPAKGFRITLELQDGAAAGGHGRSGWARNRSATVDDTGKFERDKVPPGTYQLRVTSGRRGSPLHRETVIVTANGIAHVPIALSTTTLSGTITTDDGTPVADLAGSILLLPDVNDIPTDLGQWRRANPTFSAQVRDGRFEVAMLPAGYYLAVVTIRGRDRSSALVAAAHGAANQLTIAAGRKSSKDR